MQFLDVITAEESFEYNDQNKASNPGEGDKPERYLGWQFIVKYRARFTYVIRIITNCLLEYRNVMTFEPGAGNKDVPSSKQVLEFFMYFYNWDMKTVIKDIKLKDGSKKNMS